MDKAYLIAGLIVITTIFIINITVIIYMIKNNKKLKKEVKQHDDILHKFNSTENINDEFISIYTRIGNAEKISAESIKKYEELVEKNKSKINKIGLIKYNAYDETENKLSYALCILDSNFNGIVINHVHSKHGDNSYIKEITNKRAVGRITEEEAQAIKIASSKKD